MARDRRITVFVDDQEYAVLMAVSPDDESLGRTVRRLAMDRATWLAEHGKKQRGRVPPSDSTGYYGSQPASQPGQPQGEHYDFSDSQG